MTQEIYISPDFHEQAKFNVSISNDVALVCLYSGESDDSLEVLRHKHFCEKVATKGIYVQPQSLPPTSAAENHH